MKCEFCSSEATCKLSPDIDVGGLGACEKHKEKLRPAFYVLITDGLDAYNEFVKQVSDEPGPTKKPPNENMLK